MQPGVPQAKWLQTSQIRMRFLDWGRPDAHPAEYDNTVALCLHGLASSSKWYDLVLPYLADSYHCVALDQRGHGETDQPDAGYDWRSIASDAVEALNHLGYEKAVILGHSWGAFVALAMAALHPDRVAKLCMIDGGFSDWRKRPGATYDTFRQWLRPRNVGGTPDEYLAKVQFHLRDCWSDRMEEIIMSMVRVGEDGQVTDILKAFHPRPDTGRHVGRTVHDVVRTGEMPDSNRGGRPQGQRQPGAHGPSHGYGRSRPVRHCRLPFRMDSGHHPRHRLPQTCRVGPCDSLLHRT